MRKLLSRPFEEGRPRLEESFIAKLKDIFGTENTFYCGKEELVASAERGWRQALLDKRPSMKDVVVV